MVRSEIEGDEPSSVRPVSAPVRRACRISPSPPSKMMPPQRESPSPPASTGSGSKITGREAVPSTMSRPRTSSFGGIVEILGLGLRGVGRPHEDARPGEDAQGAPARHLKIVGKDDGPAPDAVGNEPALDRHGRPHRLQSPVLPATHRPRRRSARRGRWPLKARIGRTAIRAAR